MQQAPRAIGAAAAMCRPTRRPPEALLAGCMSECMIECSTSGACSGGGGGGAGLERLGRIKALLDPGRLPAPRIADPFLCL